MAETIATAGIVLYYEPWRDYDRNYVIYTEQLGKVRARALGVRKATAKLAGVLEPFSETEVYVIIGKQYRLGGAVVRQRFAQLTSTLPKHNATLYMVECLDRLTKEGTADARLYHTLYSTLTWLNHAPYTKLLPVSFAVKLIHLSGYQVTHLAKTAAAQKLLRWLAQADYEDIQKLRLDNAIWQDVYLAVQLWLYEYTGTHVQSEPFLV